MRFLFLLATSALLAADICPNFLVEGRTAQTENYFKEIGISVAMVGDSTIQDFHMASPINMLMQLWTRRGDNPFLNTAPENGIDSFFEQLARIAPVKATDYASPGARVGPERRVVNRIGQRILGIRSFDDQVHDILHSTDGVPDLTLLWIGNNNLDFMEQFGPKSDLRPLRQEFIRNYETTLRKLIAAANAKSSRTAIVVYGIINAETTTIARNRARAVKASDENAYPHFEIADRRFVSMRPEYADVLIQLAKDLSTDLELLVTRLRNEQGTAPKVGIFYSAQMQTADFSDLGFLDSIDGWHASTYGKHLIAQALYKGATPALEFLGRHP